MKTTDSKSHTAQEIRRAIRQGKTLCHLDTANAGGDDILIGSESDVLADVLAYHEMEDLPTDWSLRAMELDDLDDLDDEEAGMVESI